jgi:hypothetical protein
MKTKTVESKALRDVWAWREGLHKDLAGLPVAELLKAISSRADESARKLGFAGANRRRGRCAAVAEAKAKYGRK